MAKNSKQVLEVKNLVKKFDGFVAVNDISFSLEEGQILGFLGPNGAGKSTTINCLTAIIKPDSGQIKFFGKELFKNRGEIAQNVNYSTVEFSLPWHLTLYEGLLVFAKLYQVKNAKERIIELLTLFEMMDFRKKLIRDLSFGQRVRGSMCRALINHPKVLLLDEPMASMDPDVVDKGIKLIKKIQKEEGMSILYTSHNMWEIEEVADRVVFINHGKVIAQGTPLELTQQELKLEAKEPNLREVFIKLSRSKSTQEERNESIL